MTDDVIVPQRTETFEQTRGEARPIGPRAILTEVGQVVVVDAPGIKTMQVAHQDASWNRVGVMIYDAPPGGVGQGGGLVCQLDADAARSVGASLLRLADWLAPRSNN
jgi:hypothetical protein